MKNLNQRKILILTILSIFMLYFYACTSPATKTVGNTDHPKIVNIINFIRLLEPRDAAITEDVLYQTVVKQVEIMQQYKLGGTFLLQYDALIDPRYQKLLKSLPESSFEIGAWWEFPQPLVENAGLTWRGRAPWDQSASIGFSAGYTPEERRKLVDVYMTDFKNIFGYYPKSVGSWFIDAYSLNYMYEKYGIVASCNCKDQIGTDGYTLWGGYWNQAYYPSLKNAYMPAQNEENQIPVPVFRMLGSDPIRQYESGLGHNGHAVITLEPVYPKAGGNSTWVNWYFKEFVEGECMEFAYTQAGQENSFTWNSMEKGFKIQMPLIAQLRDQNKVKVETLAESGKWFREKYKVTPATSVTVNEDLDGSDLKTVWFNSRFYRASLYWEHGILRIRDIHLFDENYQSSYLTEKETSNEFRYFTLPFVDGNVWSSSEDVAGLRLKAVIDGNEVLLEGGNPVVTNPSEGKLHISWPLKSVAGTFVVDFDEKQLEMKLEGNESVEWFLDLTTADEAILPFQNISPSRIDCQFGGMDYFIATTKGSFSVPANGSDLRIKPQTNIIVLKLAGEDVEK